MPIFEYLCDECGKTNELLVPGSDAKPTCRYCGSPRMQKLLSAHASISGVGTPKIPGLGDTTCCGSSVQEADCAGPGSCCGKNVT